MRFSLVLLGSLKVILVKTVLPIWRHSSYVCDLTYCSSDICHQSQVSLVHYALITSQYITPIANGKYIIPFTHQIIHCAPSFWVCVWASWYKVMCKWCHSQWWGSFFCSCSYQRHPSSPCLVTVFTCQTDVLK